MNERVKGIVEKINENASGYFGVKMGETWYGAGKFAPKFNEGDEVSFTFSMNGKYANMDFKSVEVLAAGNGSSGGGTSSQASSSAASSTGKSSGTNWDLKDKRITYLASRKDALELAGIALSNEAFKLPTKQSDKFEALALLVNELTDTFYNDVYGTSYEVEG